MSPPAAPRGCVSGCSAWELPGAHHEASSLRKCVKTVGGADRAAAGASEEKPWVTRPQTKWHLRRVPANTPWASLGHGCRGASQAGRWEAGDRHGKMYPSLFEPFAFSVKSPYYIFKKHFDFYYY